MVSVVRALLREAGYRLASGSAEGMPARLARLPLPTALAATVAPLGRVITQVSETLAEVDARLAAYAAQDPVVQRLRTVPGVGVVVGLTFRAFVDDVHRFARAAQVSAAIGLVPWEDSSAERRDHGHISKAGPRELRSLLVQAMWACCRSHGSGSQVA